MESSFEMNRALAESYIYYLYLTIDAENGVSESLLAETFGSLEKI